MDGEIKGAGMAAAMAFMMTLCQPYGRRESGDKARRAVFPP
jgi:hypothetical protein